MESTKAYIIQANSDEPRLFAFDSAEITFGRNPSNSIDIPDRLVSRHQCVVKQVDRDKWIIEDTSSQKSTVLNGNPLKGSSSCIKSSDVITFAHTSAKFIFYHSYELLPSIYKKRKRDESDLDLTQSKDSLINEVEKYKRLYENALYDMENIKEANNIMAEALAREIQCTAKKAEEDLRQKDVEANILRQKVAEAKAKLEAEENANNKMITRIQNLTEVLKDCELEIVRLQSEAYKINDEEMNDDGRTTAILKKQQEELTELQKTDEPLRKDPSSFTFSVEALNSVMGMVEVKWQEAQIEQLKEELKEKVDELTNLSYESARNRQDLLDLIDRELLCSICSEIMCNVITLNCMHSFCKACLVEWKEKKRECPVCRTKIKTEVHPLVLDSYIDRLCELVGGDIKARRSEVKAERSKLPASSRSDEGNKWRGNRRIRATPRRRRGYQQHPFQFNPVAVYPEGDVVIDVSEAFYPINPMNALNTLNVIDLTHDSPLRGSIRRSSRIQHNNNNNAH